MNNNFPNADEDDSLITKKTFGEPAARENEFENFAAPFSAIENSSDNDDLLEIPALSSAAPENSAGYSTDGEPGNLAAANFPAENFDRAPDFNAPVEADKIAENSEVDSKIPAPTSESAESFAAPSGEKHETKSNFAAPPIFAQSPYQSESSDETIRKSGLAYTAAIILLASIVFTLILGWFADLLFGTSPWGKVGGIVLGSVIGFVQFFRTTSQLVKDRD